MNKQELLKSHQIRIANVAISPSAFRNQGKKTTILRTRQILSELDLKVFSRSLRNRTYEKYLDKTTMLVLRKLPKNLDVRWGTIRKGLNIFFRDLAYNSFITKHLSIDSSSLYQLEVPLDSYTGFGIEADINKLEGLTIGWTTIRALTPEKSKIFQRAAHRVAKNYFGLKNKVDLDLMYWNRTDRKCA